MSGTQSEPFAPDHFIDPELTQHEGEESQRVSDNDYGQHDNEASTGNHPTVDSRQHPTSPYVTSATLFDVRDDFSSTGVNQQPLKAEESSSSRALDGHSTDLVDTASTQIPNTFSLPSEAPFLPSYNPTALGYRAEADRTNTVNSTPEPGVLDSGIQGRQMLAANSVESRVPCDQCSRLFANQRGVRKHIQRKHGTGQELRTISCDYCDFSFEDKKDLRRHMLTHTGERSVQCPTCGIDFTRSDNMNRHARRSHQG